MKSEGLSGMGWILGARVCRGGIIGGEGDVERWEGEGKVTWSEKEREEGAAEEGQRESRYHCKLTINELALIKEPLRS